MADGWRLGRYPESLQPLHVGRLTQLLERPLADLPDALSGHPEELADLFQSQGLAALLETIVEVQNLALARSEIALEDAVNELTHQPGVGVFLDVATFASGKPLAQRSAGLVGPFHRRVQRQFRRGHPPGRSDILDRVVERGRDLEIGRLAAELLRQKG